MYSVVIPVYNGEKSLEELYARIKATFEKMDEEFEIILVDDSSKDKSYKVMKELNDRDSRVKVVQLARNFGQHAAILCGLSLSKGEYIVTMDDDLQHPPEEIPKLIAKMQEDDAVDVVIGCYNSKKHSWFRNLGTTVMNVFSSYAFKKDADLQLTSFRLMKRYVADAMVNDMHLSYPRIGHLLLDVCNRIVNVVVEHDARQYGKSGYSLKRLVRDFFSNIMYNSALPMKAVSTMGLVSSVLSILIGIFFLIRYIFWGISVVGWTTLILVTTFFSGIILFSIGIMGEYMMRILTETKKMPNYIMRDKRL